MDLKNALLQTVSCMLSEEYDCRRLAEERQKALEVTDDYSAHLAEILLTTDEALEERQMANVLLKKYIRTHWNFSVPGFVEPVVNGNIKRTLRNVLPMGLSDSLPKVRNAVASTMAVIAAYDFPGEWPHMTDMIVSKLQSQNPNEVFGVLEFLDECTKLFNHASLMMLAVPILYDTLYHFCQKDEYPTHIRALGINIVSSLLCTDHAAQKPNSPVLEGNLERFGNLFVTILNEPYDQKSDFCLKGQIIKFLYTMECHIIPHLIYSLIEKALPIVWEILMKCNTEYIKVIMNVQTYPYDFNETHMNNPLHYINLVDNIFSLLQNVLIHVDRGRTYLYKSVPEMLHNVIIFMCITPDIETDWTGDEEVYYNDECEDSVERVLRSHVKNVLAMLVQIYPYEHLITSLELALNKILEDANRLKQDSPVFWWRAHESVMYAIGTVSTILTQENKPMFNVKPHLNFWLNFIIPQSVPRENIFLFARTLWIGGKLSRFLSKDELITHFNAILNSMTSAVSVIKISAVRAMLFHCEEVDRDHKYVALFYNNLDIIIDRLIIIAAEMPFLYADILKSIRILISKNHGQVQKLLRKLLPFLKTVFWRNMSNPELMRRCNEIIAELSLNRFTVQCIHEFMLPEILKAITYRAGNQTEISDSQSVGLCALKTIIRFAPRPTDQRLVEEGFTTLYKVALTVDDSTVLHNAASCTCSFLASSADQVYTIRDSDGQNGADFVVNIIRHMLDPQMQDVTCKSAGKLCIAALKYLSSVLLPHHMDCLIKSSLTRMNYIDNVPVEESLINIFAHLCNTHIDILVNTLSVIPGPSGDSALAFVFTRWLTRHGVHCGRSDRNVSTVALGKVLEYAVLKNDDRILNIKIRCETWKKTSRSAQNFNTSEGDIPLVARIFKVLIHILARSLRASLKQNRSLSDDDSDESGTSCSYKPNLQENFDISDVDDYLLRLDIGDYLIDYMRTFSQTGYFYTLVSYLSDMEKLDLHAIGVSTS